MNILLHLISFFVLSFPSGTSQKATVPAMHPFYVAVTEATYNEKENSLEISCKFFADDFEETLQSVYKTPLDVTADKDKAALTKYIPDYINKHLTFAADGKMLKLSYIGFEKEKESLYCYFEVPLSGAVKNIEVVNSLLHDFKKEQINIMHVTIGGKRQSSKLDYPATKSTFRF